jgi:hypothetical protein
VNPDETVSARLETPFKAQEVSMIAALTQNLPGQYNASIQSVNCTLELRLDSTGCLAGSFVADNEHLEIMGGLPNTYGEVFGLIREPSGDTMAVFRAAPLDMHLIFELDTPGGGDLMSLGNAERIVFKRQP